VRLSVSPRSRSTVAAAGSVGADAVSDRLTARYSGQTSRPHLPTRFITPDTT